MTESPAPGDPPEGDAEDQEASLAEGPAATPDDHASGPEADADVERASGFEPPA